MTSLLPSDLLDLLIVGTVLGFIVMVLIQKFKQLTFINKSWHFWIINLILSFSLCVPFTKCFYELDLLSSFWVGVFTFAGAPSIYDLLKNKNILDSDLSSKEVLSDDPKNSYDLKQ